MDTKTKYPCIVIFPKKFTLTHNVFEVIELCRTRADILKPTLDRTLVLRRTLKYKQNPQCRSFGVDMWTEKELIFYQVKSSPKSVSKQLLFFKLDLFAQIKFALCFQVEHA